ncbi:hypothetical protein BSK59_15970 [Paenibacillus odorifer]|uniref:hypothetical protein n=1 Tax=Paenibacillus odorifer TaxID=189426 RepID=UPI00096F34AA|nr:hypothetical protein [Paenibacillus odorifer]OME54077.1 hypothetical protein BSK59_15970 [Paenibacillus odorifer]
MAIRVIKSTELDGVTLKDSDTGSVLAETGVSKRVGLFLSYPSTAEELSDAKRMILTNYLDNFVEDYTIRSSDISDVDITEDGLIAVTTRNTIYFLKDEGEM